MAAKCVVAIKIHQPGVDARPNAYRSMSGFLMEAHGEAHCIQRAVKQSEHPVAGVLDHKSPRS